MQCEELDGVVSVEFRMICYEDGEKAVAVEVVWRPIVEVVREVVEGAVDGDNENGAVGAAPIVARALLLLPLDGSADEIPGEPRVRELIAVDEIRSEGLRIAPCPCQLDTNETAVWPSTNEVRALAHFNDLEALPSAFPICVEEQVQIPLLGRLLREFLIGHPGQSISVVAIDNGNRAATSRLQSTRRVPYKAEVAGLISASAYQPIVGALRNLSRSRRSSAGIVVEVVRRQFRLSSGRAMVMNRHRFLQASASLLAAPLDVAAQPVGKAQHRIGYGQDALPHDSAVTAAPRRPRLPVTPDVARRHGFALP